MAHSFPEEITKAMPVPPFVFNKIELKVFEDLDNSSIKWCTIFKVNVWLRESNPDAYTPKMVSIGPYYKKNPQLDAMEKYKLKNLQLDAMEKYKLLYRRRFLQQKEGLDVQSCINELEKLKEKAIKCYEDIEDDGLFCHMLLLDGCFVVEFIRECCKTCPEGENRIININSYYIFRDLMLLENQLPFFVLNKLYHMTRQDDELSLARLVSNFLSIFVDDMPKMTDESFGEIARCNIKHLLHLVHILSCHGLTDIKKSKDANVWHMVMPNATELSEAGVSFEKDTTRKFDIIKFEKGVMTIPCFRVTDYTEALLRNLIAYEQQSRNVYPKYFSDFAVFMDKLIESYKDVNLLRQKGIIVNWLGEDKEVASMLNKIGNGVGTSSDFYYNEECKKAVEHCKKPWNRMKANLKHNYFSSPWVGASTVAAIILLTLTTIQTILAFTGLVK